MDIFSQQSRCFLTGRQWLTWLWYGWVALDPAGTHTHPLTVHSLHWQADRDISGHLDDFDRGWYGHVCLCGTRPFILSADRKHRWLRVGSVWCSRSLQSCWTLFLPLRLISAEESLNHVSEETSLQLVHWRDSHGNKPGFRDMEKKKFKMKESQDFSKVYNKSLCRYLTCRGRSCCPETLPASCLYRTLWCPPPQTLYSPAEPGTHTPLCLETRQRLCRNNQNNIWLKKNKQKNTNVWMYDDGMF